MNCEAICQIVTSVKESSWCPGLPCSFSALTNAVCLNNASSFFVIDLCKCFLFSCFVFVYFIFLICIMHSAINLFVFPNYMFTSLLLFFVVVFF